VGVVFAGNEPGDRTHNWKDAAARSASQLPLGNVSIIVR
jgi:hypothetical protein